ncbi:MAG: AAA family ATPase [Patescibacteria group bacterium]
MYLQRIELQGFKSFAQKTVLEFPTPGQGCQIAPHLSSRTGQLPRGICGVTAIVGPNGSGKSNVVDAVRWVLGEQSLKLLRGKKSTDVIFSGSSNRSQMSLAEVSLHLNNEDKSAPVDYAEVAITRKIYRDASSQYLLNKNEVRLFDIIIFLAKANFGQNTYSIIGQGMVDRLVNYSTQERKEFFDEATGVKQFQLKRDRSVGKLKKSRENIEQVKGLLVELEPHLKSLTRQVNRLQKRKEIEKELRQWQMNYYGHLWLDLDASYQELARSFTEKEKSGMRLEREIDLLHRQLEEIGRQRGRAEEFNKLQNDYDQKLALRNSLLQSLAEVKGKLDVEYLKVGRQDLSWLERRQDELNAQLKNFGVQIADQEKQIKRWQEDLNGKRSRQEMVLSEFRELEDNLLKLQKEFQSELGISEKEIRQTVNRIYLLQRDFTNKLRRTATLEVLEDLKREADNLFAEMEVFYQRLSSANRQEQSQEIAALQNQLSGFLKDKDLLVNEINEIKIKVEVALSQKNSLRNKVGELESELNKTAEQLAKNQLAPKDQDELAKGLAAEKKELESQLAKTEKSLAEVKEQIDSFNEAEESKKQEVFILQEKMHQLQLELNKVNLAFNEVRVELAKVETKKEDLFSAMRQDLGQDYRPKVDSSLKNINIGELSLKISRLKKQLELIGGTDPEVEKEYEEVKTRYDFLSQQSDDLKKAIKDLEKVVVELDKLIKKQFEEEFKRINQDFSRYFKKLFDGGGAKLVLTQKQEEQTEAEIIREEIAQKNSVPLPENTAAEELKEATPEKKEVCPEDKSFLANIGIDIEACPPGKKIKSVSVLSGGEKTMTALALICAIIANNPSPFILFDEVDAALDENNSAKFSDIIEELAHKTQFIVITHNRAIMSRANVLYGVTMQGDGVSRLLSLKLAEAEKIGK